MISWLAARFLGLPDWAIKAIEIAVLLAALAGAIAWAHHHVYQQGYDAAKAERKADDDAALRIATAQAYTDQKALSDKFLLAQRDRFKEKQDAQATIDDLRHSVRTGSAVLHLRPGSAVCSISPVGDSAAGSGPGGEARPIQLLPDAADAVVVLAGGIKAGVQRQNDLIDAYNTARDACNKR